MGSHALLQGIFPTQGSNLDSASVPQETQAWGLAPPAGTCTPSPEGLGSTVSMELANQPRPEPDH